MTSCKDSLLVLPPGIPQSNFPWFERNAKTIRPATTDICQVACAAGFCQSSVCPRVIWQRECFTVISFVQEHANNLIEKTFVWFHFHYNPKYTMTHSLNVFIVSHCVKWNFFEQIRLKTALISRYNRL